MVIEGGNGSNHGGARRPPRRGPRVEQPQTVLRLPEDPYAADYPRRGSRGRGLVYLAMITVVVAAIIAISSSNSKHSSQTAGSGGTAGVGGGVSAPPTAVSEPAGASVTDTAAQQYSNTRFPALDGGGVLIGYPDTQQGAEAAAANYVSAYGSEAMVHPTTRHALIHTIADPAIETSLQAQLDQAFTIVDTSLGLDKNGNPPQGLTVVSREFPVGVNTTAYTKAKASVAVWADSLAGTAGAGSTHPVVETWSTIALNLTWVNGDWKWSSFSESDGPTPVSSQAASSSDVLQRAVQQFARLRYAP